MQASLDGSDGLVGLSEEDGLHAKLAGGSDVGLGGGGVAGIVPSRDFQWSFGVIPKRDERSQYEGPTTIPPSPVPQEAA